MTVRQYSNGDVYDGEWEWDNKHGQGTFNWASTGGTYTGSFVLGVVEGVGTCTFKDGSSYSEY